jgi:RES domain-containing protein
MELWRLCRRPFADLSGEGARKHGGRWNSAGRAVVYLAEHPALAMLEVRVHLDLPFEMLPEDFVLLRAALPDRWIARDAGQFDDTVAAGDSWLAERRSAGLRVPSVLAPHAWNILLNPAHADASRAHVTAIEPFRFDARLFPLLTRETRSRLEPLQTRTAQRQDQ